MPKDPAEIGSLWAKQGANGEYLTGTINGERVVLFKNTRKTNDKQPDWRVLRSQPQGQRSRPADPDF